MILNISKYIIIKSNIQTEMYTHTFLSSCRFDIKCKKRKINKNTNTCLNINNSDGVNPIKRNFKNEASGWPRKFF